MFRLIKIAIFSLFLFVYPALADNVAINQDEARDWANAKGAELIQTLGESDLALKYSKLDKMMTEDVNLDYISKFVIGKYARLMTPQQKERYNHLFRRYVLSLYKQINLRFNTDGIDFSIDNIIEHTQFTTVSCSVDASKLLEQYKKVDAQKIPVKFKLIRGIENRIQAVDVEISDVSLVIEYRKQFYKMIKEEDENIDWFLDRFSDKVRANEKNILVKTEL